jgi:N-acetylmuramoyl-L-alanine amidase
VNLTIASFVKQQLVDEGFDVDLLEEFDDKLQGYRGLALVSIHADSCEFINNEATGYKVAAALSTTNPEKASRLTSCLRDRYARYSELPYHPGSITPHMTQYHIFSEIHNETTAAIIETGFLNQDRIALTTNPEKIATGITRGILCFIYNESVSQPNVEADE